MSVAGGGGGAPLPARKRRHRPEPSPTQRALGLLTRREHSRQELARKLMQRGVDAGDAHAAVDTLAAAGWQDDVRFAAFLVRSRAGSGYGPAFIRAELGTHGLDEAAIKAAIEGFEGDWAGNARDLLRRRHPGAMAGDWASQRRATGFLLRRGFAMAHVRAAVGGT